jgi:hypothetical protein
MEELNIYVRESIKAHPHLVFTINDLYQLCLDEIEQGGSEPHEIQLCTSDIEELIKSGKTD